MRQVNTRFFLVLQPEAGDKPMKDSPAPSEAKNAGELAKAQKALLDATKALAKSQEANAAAQAAHGDRVLAARAVCAAVGPTRRAVAQLPMVVATPGHHGPAFHQREAVFFTRCDFDGFGDVVDRDGFLRVPEVAVAELS